MEAAMQLSEIEMLKLELYAEQEKVRKLTEKSILDDNEKLAIEEKLLHEKRKNAGQRYSETKRINDKAREERKQYMNELKMKFGIPKDEGLGYDPITGDIIRKDYK